MSKVRYCSFWNLFRRFFQFCSNAIMNKIQYSLTTLLNELQTFESLMKNKGQQQGEANVAHSKKFHKGSSSRTKFVSSSSEPKSSRRRLEEKRRLLSLVKARERPRWLTRAYTFTAMWKVTGNGTA